MTVLYCPLFLIYICKEIEFLCLTNFWLANSLKQHSDEHDENAQSAVFHPNLAKSQCIHRLCDTEIDRETERRKKNFYCFSFVANCTVSTVSTKHFVMLFAMFASSSSWGWFHLYVHRTAHLIHVRCDVHNHFFFCNENSNKGHFRFLFHFQ